jgi:hypothetical protein
MTDRELMQQALDALEIYGAKSPDVADTITVLRERLAQPEQEPVAWADMVVRGEEKGLSWTPGHFHKTPLYTAPRQWQGLTDEEFQAIAIKYALPTPTGLMYFKDEIEAKLKEKNHA